MEATIHLSSPAAHNDKLIMAKCQAQVLHGSIGRSLTIGRELTWNSTIAGILGWLLVVVLFAPTWGGSLRICYFCCMLYYMLWKQ